MLYVISPSVKEGFAINRIADYFKIEREEIFITNKEKGE